ncbi:MAG: DUF3408 domain-containing protein [Rikenellaceae bacterium]|nr:DUF3408 domain-containing protein [Rikenellaceae bacterium]
MARKNFDPSQIDEQKLLEMIATVPEIAIPAQDSKSQTANPPQTPTTANHPGDTDESRMIPQPDYEETFLRKISLKHRVAVYVSEETRDKLAKITCLGPYDFSISSLVENILQNHFKLFRGEINERYRKLRDKGFLCK